jgi:hypothetical protein
MDSSKDLLIKVLTNKIESCDYRDGNLSMKTTLDDFNNNGAIMEARDHGLPLRVFGDLYNKITLTATHLDYKHDCKYDYDYLMGRGSWGKCEINIKNEKNSFEDEKNECIITNKINEQLETIAQLLITYMEIKDIWKVFPDISCKGYNSTEAYRINEKIPIAGRYEDVHVVPMVLFVFTKLSVEDLLQLVDNS